eukprot:g770.t1
MTPFRTTMFAFRKADFDTRTRSGTKGSAVASTKFGSIWYTETVLDSGDESDATDECVSKFSEDSDSSPSKYLEDDWSGPRWWQRPDKLLPSLPPKGEIASNDLERRSVCVLLSTSMAPPLLHAVHFGEDLLDEVDRLVPPAAPPTTFGRRSARLPVSPTPDPLDDARLPAPMP